MFGGSRSGGTDEFEFVLYGCEAVERSLFGFKGMWLVLLGLFMGVS